MSFPKNTPLPTPEPDLSGFPADVTVPNPGPQAAQELQQAQQQFRRFERPAPSAERVATLHIGLFLVTLVTTTLAGIQLTRGGLGELPDNVVDLSGAALWAELQRGFGLLPLEVFALRGAAFWAELQRGLWYALPFLGVLTVHEFGHYFTARYNRVRTSLPYYVPFPLGLGTFGAVIRIREAISSRREFFDIGLAGPLAGFLVAVLVLIYGFTHLPPLDYLFAIHPEYARYGADYARHAYPPGTAGLTLAQPLLFQWLAAAFAEPARLPHPNELVHYPVLLAGELSLFFTALNLLPLGQLDGGHILYGLLGPRHFNRLAPVLFTGFIFYAGLGLFSLHDDWQTWLYGAPVYAGYLGLIFWRVLPRPYQGLLLAAGIWAAQLACTVAFPKLLGNPGWLVFGLLLGRLTGIYHPDAPDERGLSLGRQILGWVMVAIFVVCFTPSPFVPG